MALTDVKIRSLASEKGKMKHHDRDELYLYVYFKKKIDGKVREIRIGNYPAISLAEARKKSDEIRDRFLRGEELLEKASEKEIYTVEKAVTEWFSAIRGKLSEATAKKTEVRIKCHILPAFGDIRIDAITPQMFLDYFKSLAEKRLFETAEIISSYLTRTYDRAMLLEKCAGNPAQVARKIYLRETKKEVCHLKARLEPESIRELFRLCNEYGRSRCDTVRNALVFQALTACRPGNAQRAEWSEIDMERKIWVIPAEKMKMRKAFNIPLSPYALTILSDQKPISSGSKYVFPGKNNVRPITEEALSVALKTMGIRDHVPHGWRSSFSTTLNESGKFRREAIDMCLAHKVGDAVEQAYNRSQLWNERVEIFNWWADFLTKN